METPRFISNEHILTLLSRVTAPAITAHSTRDRMAYF